MSKECDHIIKAKMISPMQGFPMQGFEGRIIAYCSLCKTEWSTPWTLMSNIRKHVGKDATVATKDQ